MKIGSRYITMRITEDEARASLHAVAEHGEDAPAGQRNVIRLFGPVTQTRTL